MDGSADTVRTKTSIDEGFLSQRTDEGSSSGSGYYAGGGVSGKPERRVEQLQGEELQQDDDSSDTGDRFSSEGSSGIGDHMVKVRIIAE